MRVKYSAEVDSAYISLREIGPGEAVQQLPVLDDLLHAVLDFDAEGRLIGIDVMAADATLPRELLANAERYEQP